MTNYRAELLDTETDEVVELFTFQATNEEEAAIKAEEEAEYQGLFLGSIKIWVR